MFFISTYARNDEFVTGDNAADGAEDLALEEMVAYDDQERARVLRAMTNQGNDTVIGSVLV